jgi:bleomycin hydrolase
LTIKSYLAQDKKILAGVIWIGFIASYIMKKWFTALLLIWLCVLTTFAQDSLTNITGSSYRFSVVKQWDALPIQSQDRSLTCWSFSALSLFESELIRKGKGKHKLSEMFVVRNAYIGKGDMYVRMGGQHSLAGGGAFHDIPWVLNRHGMVPHEVYEGLHYGMKTHNHTEMDRVLKAMADAVTDSPQKTLTPAWRRAFTKVVDEYLGPVPESFSYMGKTYTPRTFASFLDLNTADYISLTSFTHHPFYQPFVIEVPDNWAMAQSYNLPLNEFTEVMEHAILNGYTFAWGADISEKGFDHKKGLAIVPAHDSMVKVTGQDGRVFDASHSAQRAGIAFYQPMPELTITQDLRQQAFDAQETTDDHGMHVTGLVTDQNGKKYYLVKNSWGTQYNECGGYLYASTAYMQYKTINIMVHKEALPKAIKKKLQL